MYTKLNDYLIDCLTVVYGTWKDPNYLDYPFENILETSPIGNAGSVFRKCIECMKSLSDVKYFNEETFREYYLNTLGSKVFTEEEDVLIKNTFVKLGQFEGDLKDPTALYASLSNAYKKSSLKDSMSSILKEDELGENPLFWTDDFYNNLILQVDNIEEARVEEENMILFGEDVGEYYDEVLTERETREPVTFGWKVIDDLIPEGPTQGHGGCIAGSTGMGKSALALNIFDHLIEYDVPTMYAPIEMGVENTVDRLVAHRIKVPYNELVKLKKSEQPDILEMIQKEMKRLKVHDHCAILQDPVIDLAKLERYIKKFQKYIGQKYCIIIIDLLTMITEFYSGESLPQAIEKAINALDILSKKLGFHYIGVVQLNRTIEQDKVLSVQSIDKLKPTRSSIKNSSAILERARYCLTIFRPAYFAKLYLTPEEASTVEDVAEVTLMKANNEDAGRIYLNYDGPTFTLTEREGIC